MGEIDKRAVDAAARARITHLEAQVVEEIASRTGMDAASSLDFWYKSDLSLAVELNECGLQYLDAGYLVDELMPSR